MPRLTLVTAVLLSAFVVMHLPRSMDPLDSFAVAEQARVRAHFDSAEREVRGNPVTGLSTAQRAARARALDRLHAYAARGVFPRNRHFPGALVPSFVDDRTGTRCGMAYLIEQSGDAGLVTRVAATNNNASIPDLKGDPELLSWLERNGLTLEEAARIQPSYGCEGLAYPPCPPSPASATYKVATGVSVGADVLTVALNAAPTHLSRTLTGALGFAAGVVGMVIGVPNTDESGSKQTLGWVNAGMGAVSAAVGAYRLLSASSSESQIRVAPWISAGGAPGLSGRITF